MHNVIGAVKKMRGGGGEAWPDITYFDDSQFRNINKNFNSYTVFFFFENKNEV